MITTGYSDAASVKRGGSATSNAHYSNATQPTACIPHMSTRPCASARRKFCRSLRLASCFGGVETVTRTTHCPTLTMPAFMRDRIYRAARNLLATAMRRVRTYVILRRKDPVALRTHARRLISDDGYPPPVTRTRISVGRRRAHSTAIKRDRRRGRSRGAKEWGRARGCRAFAAPRVAHARLACSRTRPPRQQRLQARVAAGAHILLRASAGSHICVVAIHAQRAQIPNVTCTHAAHAVIGGRLHVPTRCGARGAKTAAAEWYSAACKGRQPCGTRREHVYGRRRPPPVNVKRGRLRELRRATDVARHRGSEHAPSGRARGRRPSTVQGASRPVITIELHVIIHMVFHTTAVGHMPPVTVSRRRWRGRRRGFTPPQLVSESTQQRVARQQV